MKKTLITAILSLSMAVYGSAQSGGYRWTRFDHLPAGANITQLDYDNNGNIYALVKNALTLKSSIFYSENSGESWTEIPGGNAINNHTHIEVDKASGALYVGTLHRGISWTSNKGVTWKHNPIYTMPTSGMNAYVNQIARKSGTNIVVCNEPGMFTSSTIYTSTSDGLFWSSRTAPFGIALDLLFLESGALLAGTDNGIFLSTDDGVNWAARNAGITNLSVSSIHEDKETGSIYIGVSRHSTLNDTTGAGVYKSTDNAATWHRISAGIPDNRVTSIAMDTSGIIYAATPSGIFYSNNDGAAWVTNVENLPAHHINSIISVQDKVYSGSAQFGAARRSISDARWQLINSNIVTGSMKQMLMTSSAAYQVLAQTMGVFRKEAGTWHHEVSDFPAITPAELLVQGNGDTLFAAFTESFNEMVKSGGLYRSTDNGANWHLFSGNIPLPAGLNYNSYRDLAVTPSGKVYLFIARSAYTDAAGYHNFEEILVTSNGGTSWETIYAGNIVEMDVDRNEHVYIRVMDTTDFRFKYMHSEDHIHFDSLIIDATLMTAMSSGDYLQLYIDNEDSLYLADRNIIYKQTPEGWTALANGGWPAGMHEYYIVKLTFDRNNMLYAMVNGDGIYRTSDDGSVWENISSGIPSYTLPVIGTHKIQIANLTFDEEHTPYFMASLAPDSLYYIYKYTDEVLSVNSPTKVFRNISVFPNPATDKVLYELKLSAPSTSRIDLFHTNGALIHSETKQMSTGLNKGAIDLSNCSPGTYYIRITNDEGSFSSKIVKI